MNHKDQISGVFWFLISLIVIQQSLSMGVGNFRTPGEGAFPLICGIALFILSIMILVKASVRVENNVSRGQLIIDWHSFGRIAVVIGSLLVYIFIFPHLGFFISTFWLLFFLFRNPQRSRWWFPLLAAGMTVIVSYMLFHIGLKVEFPRGPWRIM